MVRTLVLIVGTHLMAGCASYWSGADTQTEVIQYDEAPELNVVNITSRSSDTMRSRANALNGSQGTDYFGSVISGPEFANGQGVYNGRMLTKHVGDYVQNMTQDLVSNMEYLSDKTPVGVTHFALLDSDLQTTNLLGYQLAESFMHELHKFRIPVIDYKATEYIRVTEQGDFVLSRDFLELNNTATIEYILTGTLTRHQGGYLVNARILGLQSKAVVASAQTLVPFYVVDALIPSEEDRTDGIKLRQGD